MSKINHPEHYNRVPGIECIDVVEHFNFNRGNAIKYIWRAGNKGDEIEDLKKAIWYLEREIENIRKDNIYNGPIIHGGESGTLNGCYCDIKT